jgi:hypothetical protein
MNPDLLERHFHQTDGLTPAASERIARTLDQAIRASTDPPGDTRRYRLPRPYLRRRLVAVPLVAVLLTVAATLAINNRPAPKPSIVRISDVYSLASPGASVNLSRFDTKTRLLLKTEGISGAWDIGTAAGRSFYRLTTGHGRSCYGQAADSGDAIAVSQLFCFKGAGLPGPVVDMSTVALDPTKPDANLRLIAVSGIAASEVKTIRLTSTDGTVTGISVAGDVYALPSDQLPAGVASIAAISRSGRVIWSESF